MWVIAPWMAEALHTGDIGVDVIRGLMLCLPFYSVADVSQELLRRELAFKRRVVPDIVGAVVGAGVSVALAIDGHGVYSLVVGQLVQAALIMVLCWVMRPPVYPGWSWSDMRGLVSYGGHLAAASIVQMLMLNIDYLVVARVLGADALGLYSMAFRLAYMPYLLVGMVIAGAVFAFLCRLEGPAVGYAVGQAIVALAVIAVPAYIGMILLAPQMALLGDQWSPAVPALRWLAVYGLVLSVVHVIIIALNAVSRTRDGLVLSILHLLFLTGILLWWVRFGIQLVAVAQVVAAVATLGVAAALFHRRIDGLSLRLLASWLRPVLWGALGMTVVAVAVQRMMPWTVVSVPGLFLVGCLMVAAYVTPLWWARARLTAVASLRSEP